jgi:tRNA-2-methylthio-N6-dimethylallyladenosine synthase
MNAKYLYINTIGCQMNVYDSEQIVGHLALHGYQQTASPEAADLIIVNTCTIREKAEQKAYSFLGRLARLKRKKNSLIIGIGGCVAQQDGEQILKRMPFVDIVFGTQAIHRLPDWIRQIEKKRCQIVDVELNEEARADEPIIGLQGETQSSRFITIMRGCDNYCAYCVVPFVRGRETSRPPNSIIKEIRSLVSHGVREVTLLGQNWQKRRSVYICRVVGAHRWNRRLTANSIHHIPSQRSRCGSHRLISPSEKIVPSHSFAGTIGLESSFKTNEPQIQPRAVP